MATLQTGIAENPVQVSDATKFLVLVNYVASEVFEYISPKILAKDCRFDTVTNIEYRDEIIRDSFINGLQSNYIRQKLFEMKELDLKTAIEQTRALEISDNQAGSYVEYGLTSHALATPPPEPPSAVATVSYSVVVAAIKQKCFFCDFDCHLRGKCPATDAKCKKRWKTGHRAKCCR